MAPEAPGNLVVLDLRYNESGTLLMTVEEVIPPPEEPNFGWLRVRFEEAPGQDFYPVGQGVVSVSQPDGYKHCPPGAENEVLTVDGGPRRYVFHNVAQGEGLQLILVLPQGYTLREFDPVPTSARDFRGRIAVYFRPKERYGETATVSWQLATCRRTAASEAKRLRGEFVRLRQSRNAGAHLDREDPDFKEAKVTRKRAGSQGASADQPLPAWAYAAIAVAGLLAAVGLTLFYVYQGSRIAESGAQGLVSSVLQVFIALACATFLFGAMKSTGKFRSKRATFGGPAALFIVVLSILVGKESAADTFDLTVRPHGTANADAIIKTGQITVDLDNDRRTQSVNPNGEADFKGVPTKFRGKTVDVLPQVDGYKQEWQHLRISSGVLDLTLRTDPVVTHLAGAVVPPPKDWAKLLIMVDGEAAEGRVNELGRFDFPIGRKNGDVVRLKIYDDAKIVFDDFVTISGPLNLRLNAQ